MGCEDEFQSRVAFFIFVLQSPDAAVAKQCPNVCTKIFQTGIRLSSAISVKPAQRLDFAALLPFFCNLQVPVP